MIMPVSVALSNSMDERISAASSKPQPEKGAKTANSLHTIVLGVTKN